jgi:hypothetical protein
MRKKNKIFFCIVCSLLVAWQVFGLYFHKGNLVFFFFYESRQKGDIEIYIDGKKIKTLEDDSIVYYFYSTFVSPKNHILVIKFNNFESEEIKFNAILFTCISVDIQSNRYDNPDNIVHFRINKSKWPLIFVA